MAPTILFLLIVVALIVAAAKLYGHSTTVPPQDTFMEDRLSRLMPADLIDEVRAYANRSEQSVEEVIEEALRDYLGRRGEGRGGEPMGF